MRCRAIFVLVGIAAMTAVHGANAAQECIDYGVTIQMEEVAALPAEIKAVCRQDDYLYAVLRDSTLQVLDVSDLMAPVPVASLALSEQVTDIFLCGDHAYIVYWCRQVLIVDISDPLSPALVGQYEFISNVNERVYRAPYLYLMHGDMMQIYDMTDPLAPVVVSAMGLTDAEYATTALLYGDLLLLPITGSGRGLHIVDVSDPTAPALLSVYKPGGHGAWHVAVRNHYAYVCAYDGIWVLDISDPGAPVEVAGPDGTYRSLFNFQIHGDAAYGRVTEGLRLFRFTGETTYQHVTGVVWPYPYYGHSIFDGHLYQWHEDRIAVADVSDPHPSDIIHEHLVPDNIEAVHIDGNLAYVTSHLEGLRILDISDPRAPVVLGQHHLPHADCIDVEDGLAGVITYSYPLGYFYIFDVSDPGNPTQLWCQDLGDDYIHGWYRCAIKLRDGLAYVGRRELRIYDLANPSAPELLGMIHMPNVRDIELRGDWAYLAVSYAYENIWGWEYKSWLAVVYIGNPTRPQQAVKFALPGMAEGLEVRGDYAYVGTGSGGLQVVDVRFLYPPQVVGSFDPWLRISRLELSGSLIYAVGPPAHQNGHYSLQVIDIDDPTSPRLVGSLLTRSSISDVELGNEAVYVATYDRGIIAVPYDCADPMPVFLDDFVAAVLPAGVELTWRTRQPAEVADFRLQAATAHATWDVNVEAVGDELFRAVDVRGLAMAGERIEYRLYRRDEVGWILLQSRTVDVTPAVVETAIHSVHPNPFNPRVEIAVDVAAPQRIDLSIYDLRGRRVATLADRVLPAGRHTLCWNGCDRRGNPLASGTYFARFRGAAIEDVRKLVLVR